jgi:hypothetical protein
LEHIFAVGEFLFPKEADSEEKRLKEELAADDEVYQGDEEERRQGGSNGTWELRGG